MPPVLVDVLGWVCVLWGAATSVPQLLRLLQQRTSAGVSLLAWNVWCAAGAAWMVHGILQRDPVLIIPNLIGLVTATAILVTMQRDRRLATWRTFGIAALIVLVGVVLRLTVGPVVFATFMVVPQTLAMLGNQLDLMRCPDITGVSGSYLWVALGLQTVWLLWAIGKPDTAILISALVTGSLALLNLAWYYLRRAHVVKPLLVR